MKTPSSELFDLIHSLPQNEKRHFVLFAGMDRNSEEDKRYIRLFNVIASQSAYDEAAARKSTGIVKPNDFKRIKNYTLEMVLRSQENFYANTTIENQIARRLMQVEILYRKKQLSMVRKCLQKATKLAKQHDKILDLAKCYEWYSRIANATAHPRDGLTKEFLREIRSNAQQCARWVELRRLNNELWCIIHEADSITAPYRKQLHRIVQETKAILKQGEAGLTLKKEGWSVLAIAYRFLDDWTKSYAIRKEFMQLYESDQSMLHHNAAEYIVAIGNVTNACREMGRYKEADALYDKVRSFYHDLPVRFRTMRLEERYLNMLNSYVTYLAKQHNYAEALKRGEMLIPELAKHKHTFQNSLERILLETMTLSAFYTGEYRKAMQHFTKLTQGEHKWSSPLFGLAIIYESGNSDLLHYRARSYGYYLRKSGKKFHPALLSFFTTRLPRVSGKAETREAFRLLNDIMQDPGIDAKSEFGALDWKKWIARHL